MYDTTLIQINRIQTVKCYKLLISAMDEYQEFGNSKF